MTLYDLIQTDIIITPSHNGAALVNLAGELVGIIVQAFDGPVGFSFAIGMDTAVPVARQLVELGRVRYPYLGVLFSSSSQGVVVSEIREEFTPVVRRASTEDPIVAGVSENWPAGQAGIKRGDVIVSLDGHEVASTDDVRRLLRREFEVGQEISVINKTTRDTDAVFSGIDVDGLNKFCALPPLQRWLISFTLSMIGAMTVFIIVDFLGFVVSPTIGSKLFLSMIISVIFSNHVMKGMATKKAVVVLITHVMAKQP
ncbi:MAG: PDZ domain-containing protein [Candidatus Marinimicrobia bacterium]|nr:PDZ domain-containing protein [Candidatus Neomarinimicrobiota bacterium]